MACKNWKFIALVIISFSLMMLSIVGINTYRKTSDNQQIDLPIYVITLERTPERYTKINEKLNALGLSHIKFNAIDGYNLAISSRDGRKFVGKEINNLMDDPHFAKNFDEKFTFFYNGQQLPDVTFQRYKWHMLMTIGECGLALSHREVLKQISNADSDYAIVFEDDANIPDDFAIKIKRILANLPEDFDIILLHTQVANEKLQPFSEEPYKLIPTNSTLAETPGYIVKKSSIRKLLSLTANIFLPIDDLFAFYVNNKQLNIYRTVDSITPPDTSIPSEIQRMGRGY